MARRTVSKRSKHELKRIVEDAVNLQCSLPRPGLWFAIDELQTDRTKPPSRIQAWGTLHFTSDGSPFCCGEPDCHMGPMVDERDRLIADGIRRSLGLVGELTIDLRIGTTYHDGVDFQCGRNGDEESIS